MITVCHLIDDLSPGGVTEYLQFLQKHPGMAELAHHKVVPVSRYHPARAEIEGDVIVSHLGICWRGMPGLVALRAQHPKTPLVHVEHSYCEGFAALNVPHQRRFTTLLRCAYAMFDRVVAVSAAQAAWLRRKRMVRAELLTVISPSVMLSGLEDLAAPQEPIRRIGALGRLHPQKGFDLLIQAFREVEVEGAELMIFGDGSEAAALRAAATGDRRIRFCGHVSKTVALQSCDAIAMPSRWEPYGLVAQEARMAGRMVLSSGRDGLRDQVGPGVIEVKDYTVDAWAGALEGLMTLPPVSTSGALLTRPTVAAVGERCVQGWRLLLADLCPPAELQRVETMAQ